MALKKLASYALLVLLFLGLFVFAFTAQPARGQTGTIYINPDGSVSPSTANVTTSDDVTYSFTGNNYLPIIVNRDNIIISGMGHMLQVSGGIGFSLTGRNNVTIINTTITNSFFGIFLKSSSGNVLADNNAEKNSFGIWLASSSGNTLTANEITANDYGVTLNYSSSNLLSGNNVTANIGDGFDLYSSSDNNTLSNNNIAGNSVGVILAYSSSGNRIFHNAFSNNVSQAVVSRSTVVWDDGYPSGGNYWSDYNGVDIKRGPYQNETGSDGIGDTPYVIDSNNTDRYPLMKPYAGPHDVGVVSLSVSKTVVGRGYWEDFRFKIINYGVYNETVFTEMELNQSSIDLSVPLPSRSSSTYWFLLNTTSFTYGSYNLTIYAHPVPGETDTTDNTRSASFKVTIPGDINGDFKVGTADLHLLGVNWGLAGTNMMDPNADIGGYGVVGTRDLQILGVNWGLST